MKASCGMKLAAMVAVSALAPVVAIADSNVIGFWDFKNGTVGEDAVTVTSSSGQWTGTAYKANASGNKGTLPTFSDACPPAVIFADASCSEVLASDPHSLHFSIANDNLGGYVDIAGLSTELTSHSAFTVEFFAYFDDASGNAPWTEPLCFRTEDRYATVTFGQGDTKRMKFGNLSISAPNTGPIKSSDISKSILNSWIHVAMVYEEIDSTTHAGALKCYVDRELKDTLAYTNTPLGQTSRPLRLGTTFGSERVANGSYSFRGNVCALRVKSVALDESGFMYSDKYAVPVGETLGFWDFKDGVVGTDANNVTNKGWLALSPGVGDKLKNKDQGKKPQFSDDIPGHIIYSDASYQTVLVENPQSLLFTTEGADTSVSDASVAVGGGKVAFPELGSAITSQSSYTIECFFKDEDWSEWQWSSGLFGFYANRADGLSTNVQVMVSSVKSNKTSWNATLDPSGARYNKSSTWKDGNWHHLAVVYDGSSSNVSLYVDYALGQTVAYTNYYRANQNFLLGVKADGTANYTFRGKIACLRVMAEALDNEDFMVAVDDPRAIQAAPDTVFAWNFEEGVDKIGLVITNAAGVPTFFETSADNTKVYCIFKNTLPQYASNRLVRKVMWNGEKLWENNVCGYFQGRHAVQGQTNDSYAGTEMNLPASSLPRRNPESWTMEARVKLEYLPTFLTKDDDIGALIFGKNGNTVIHVSGGQAVFPAYSWILTVQKSGLLRIYWEIDDGVDHTENKGDRLYVDTDSAYLSDMKWHHVALSYDKPTRTFKLYIDKRCVLEKYIGETDLFDGPFPYYFTRMQATRGLEGWMDEIRFSDKVLQPEEFEQFASLGMLIFVR